MDDKDFEQQVDISAPPEPPHFDDARTVHTAQPVVPLDAIDATVKKRRRLFVIGAFVIAMVLGAASALVASYLKLRNAPITASEATQELAVEPESVAISGPVPAESPVAEDEAVAEEDIQAPNIFVAPIEKPKRGLPRRRNADVEPVREVSSEDEEEELKRIRDAVLYDEWQERRARRVRRERRRNERYNHRDLSNLDEIFEGRRRRPN